MPQVNAVPYQNIAGPIEVYRAPVATVFPAIDAAPAGTWILVGATGSKDYSEDGVRVGKPQDVSKFFTLGGTGPKKYFRNQEEQEVEFTLHDYTLESGLIMALNKLSTDIITTAAGAGTAGHKAMPLLRGFAVNSFAWLLRCGLSPYGTGFNHQIEIPLGSVIGEPDITYVKDVPVGMTVLIGCLEDASAGFGTIRMQHALAS